MIINCVVAAENSNGEPDFYFVKVECSQKQYDEGFHYEVAKAKANMEGYRAYLAYDQNDTAGKMLSPLFAWITADLEYADTWDSVIA